MGERRWDTGAAAPGKSYGEAICSAARPASCDVFSAKALSAHLHTGGSGMHRPPVYRMRQKTH